MDGARPKKALVVSSSGDCCFVLSKERERWQSNHRDLAKQTYHRKVAAKYGILTLSNKKKKKFLSLTN
ncbi:hypothetical protein MUK42_03718 [Musa troglodytarum]|uniref:Uncharacterized protein n=1 Tax=Musa troglodytarum TaxID=320322 RepID=A0A9E7GJI0_9LILI|nr:hypothetical protein MUK42_03718 [Musa troglodytarum]